MLEPDPTLPSRLHLWVTGRVQGVGFRSFVQDTGNRLRLTGWVRNTGYDGVETVAEGGRATLERFASLVKSGPPAGRVDAARLEWETWTGEYSGFVVRSSR